MILSVFNKVILYAHFVLLHIFVVWISFWEMGGRHEFCFGSNAVLDETTCTVLNSGELYVSVFILLLWMTLVSVIHFLSLHADFRKIIMEILKVVFVPLLLLLAIGFYGFRFCLGFLGCSTVYLWPFTIPFVLAYLITTWLYVVLIYKHRLEGQSMKMRIVVCILIGVLASLYLYALSTATSYLASIDLNIEKINIINSHTVSDGQLLLSDKKPPTMRSNYERGIFLLAEREFVEVTVESGSKITPSYLLPVDDQGHTDKVYSNSRDYYIEKGIIHAKLSHIPLTYNLYAIKTGLTDLEFTSDGKVFGSLQNIPVITGTTMTISVTRENEVIHLWEVEYTASDEIPNLNEKISWKENTDYTERTLNLMNHLVRSSNLSELQKLELIEILEMDFPDEEMMRSGLQKYLLASNNFDDEKIKISRELAASLILSFK
jgi:hypothetical protein